MPTKKTAKKTAKSATPAKSDEPQIGEHDVVLEYALTLRTADGDPVDVRGSIPFNNALVPVFIADTQESIHKMVETVVRERFLLQTRHFFNQKREANVPRVNTQPLLEAGESRQTPEAPAPDTTDSSFEFEKDDNDEPTTES